MTNPIAMLTSAAVLALTALFLFRWDIQTANDSGAKNPIDSYAVYRLDRWTGSVTRCASSVSMAGKVPCE